MKSFQSTESMPSILALSTIRFPPTQENARDMIAKGVNMLILGNDMYHLQSAFKGIMTECVAPIRKG